MKTITAKIKALAQKSPEAMAPETITNPNGWAWIQLQIDAPRLFDALVRKYGNETVFVGLLTFKLEITNLKLTGWKWNLL